VIVDVVQRWRGRRSSYRPVGELMRFDPAKHEVECIAGPGADTTARAFVVENHYARSMGAARERVGLYRGGVLVGLAVFTMPSQVKVLDHLPCPREVSVELGRLVMLDSVEANGESWFIARALELLRGRGFEGIVSHADPVPRTNLAGEEVKPGHIGRIYQASNAVSKIRGRERGWRHAVDQLVAAGAAPPEHTGTAGDLHDWLRIELPRVTRPLKHPGNYRYLIGLTPWVKRHLPKSLPYPKLTLA